MREQPLVGVVVVNWRGEAQTARCLESLASLEYPSYRVCVVDNGSRDGGPEAVSAGFPWADIVALPDNRGYAGGCNAGIAWARSIGAEYVWLLNNDTTVESDALSRMVRWSLSAAGDGSIVAPQIIATQTGRIWSAGGFIRRPWFKADHYGIGEPASGGGKPRPVEWASGCSLLFSLRTADKVGPLDERYFLYLEDADWCLRAAKRGVQTWYTPDAVIKHEVSSTTGALDSRIVRYYAYRNHYLLAFAHSSLVGRAWFSAHLTFTLAKIAFRSLSSPSHRRDSYYQARTRAIFDFLRGRSGKAPFPDTFEPSLKGERVTGVVA